MFQMGRIGDKKGRVFKANKLSKLDSLEYAIAYSMCENGFFKV